MSSESPDRTPPPSGLRGIRPLRCVYLVGSTPPNPPWPLPCPAPCDRAPVGRWRWALCVVAFRQRHPCGSASCLPSVPVLASCCGRGAGRGIRAPPVISRRARLGGPSPPGFAGRVEFAHKTSRVGPRSLDRTCEKLRCNVKYDDSRSFAVEDRLLFRTSGELQA